MKRLFPFALAMLLAGPAAAQTVTYDFAATTDCIAAAGDDYGAKLACIGTAATACMDNTDGGWSTAGQNACLDAEWQDWDARLNAAYPRLMAQLKEEDAAMASGDYTPPSQADALRQMQRAWIPFRDAACAYEASKWTGGSGAGPATLWCLVYETAKQTLRLEADLSGDDQ